MRGQLIRRYFVTGLLIWVPLAITAWVLSLIVGTLDKTLHVLPSAFHPKQTLGVDLPGAGLRVPGVPVTFDGARPQPAGPTTPTAG